MDGTMTGYYHRQGVPNTYVIFIEGGGSCQDEATCKQWAKEKGSSSDFQRTSTGDHSGVAVSNCTTNPYFCNATAAVVPYCTADGHRGNNAVASADTWGWIFDGHLNFVAIVEELVKTRGLGDAKRILLTGSSAGGIGTFANLDWLVDRFPGVDIKAAPQAGWFFPAALPGDLDDIYPPSDFPHFYAGTHGNAQTVPGAPQAGLARLKVTADDLNADCVAAQKPEEWWACVSAHKLYPHLKAPIYIIENMYDTNQIYSSDGKVPKAPANDSEAAAVQRYVGMYGGAMRNSTAQLLHDNGKRVRDGLFLPSCFDHPVDFPVTITPAGAGPQSWQLLLGDWFFERNDFQQFHRLVESCPTDMPCNPLPTCRFDPPPDPAPCKAELTKDGCLPNSKADCEKCAQAHGKDLEKAGCTTPMVKSLCSAGTMMTAANTTLQYFGFWGPDAPATMSSFTNLAFANSAAEAVSNHKLGMHSLLKLHGAFVNSTVKWHFCLRTDYAARWAALAPELAPLLANGSLLGFFLGDELLWNGMSFAELQQYATAVRATFPRGSAVIYTNAAWPTLLPTMPGQPQALGTLGAVPDANLWQRVPDALDWFSVDVYPNEASLQGAYNMLHSWVAPKLQPHHRLVLVPPFYGDGPLVPRDQMELDCDDSDCDAAMLRWANRTVRWASPGGASFSDRVVAVTPYHWSDLNNGTGVRDLGGKHLPRARAAWEELGRAVVKRGFIGAR